MDIRVLRYFIEIVQEGTISRAAAKLHLSQPALSRQIIDLENELGVQLLIRGKRKVTPTQEGNYLYERAQEIISMVDKTKYNLQSDSVISGSIFIGSGESHGFKAVAKILSEIMRDHPDVKVRVMSGDGIFVRNQLDQGILDFGVVMSTQKLNDYNSIFLPFKNEWGVLMRSDNPLAKKDAISPADLVGQRLMTSFRADQNEIFRDWGGNYFKKLNFACNYNLIYNAALLVEEGAGVCLCYKKLFPIEKGLVFKPLTPGLTESMQVIWLKNKVLSNVDQLFIKMLYENVAKS
jgi:DNA-binding transcriptional LysR family regulator